MLVASPLPGECPCACSCPRLPSLPRKARSDAVQSLHALAPPSSSRCDAPDLHHVSSAGSVPRRVRGSRRARCGPSRNASRSRRRALRRSRHEACQRGDDRIPRRHEPVGPPARRAPDRSLQVDVRRLERGRRSGHAADRLRGAASRRTAGGSAGNRGGRPRDGCGVVPEELQAGGRAGALRRAGRWRDPCQSRRQSRSDHAGSAARRARAAGRRRAGLARGEHRCGDACPARRGRSRVHRLAAAHRGRPGAASRVDPAPSALALASHRLAVEVGARRRSQRGGHERHDRVRSRPAGHDRAHPRAPSGG